MTQYYKIKKHQGQKNGQSICYTTYYWKFSSVTYDLLNWLYLRSVPSSRISLTIRFTLLSLISNLKASSPDAPVLFNVASFSNLNLRVSFWNLFIIARINIVLKTTSVIKLNKKADINQILLELFYYLVENNWDLGDSLEICRPDFNYSDYWSGEELTLSRKNYTLNHKKSINRKVRKEGAKITKHKSQLLCGLPCFLHGHLCNKIKEEQSQSRTDKTLSFTE